MTNATLIKIPPRLVLFSHWALNLSQMFVSAVDMWEVATHVYPQLNLNQFINPRTKVYGLPKPSLRKVKSLIKLYKTNKPVQTALSHLKDLKRFSIFTLSINHPLYPQNLRNSLYPPFILYCARKPHKSWLERYFIGVVGTRNPSFYTIEKGVQKLSTLAKSKKNIAFVSGRAKGCDSIATYVADKNKIPVINVVAELSVLDFEPWEHEYLVSEYLYAPANTFKIRLVMRNRIIGGLAEELVLLQAPLSSGALITAQFAQLLKKPIKILKPNKTDFSTAGGVYLYKNYELASWF